ncbi:hypothetical protein MmmBen468_0660 [Mycoplasma mycoides subsp. mycoides]|nr:hypothetical protein MmmBen_0649 [Mycoplasma mycoides subsp. mycoides]AME11817.1 hypothetical protein MmmBen50_0634 [Mycoplasma mycoides subsp. mycoides]AME14874.1 hypothetical protein MmmBen468_0660 [Mycoplasma mycoides subsp. mycoides]
MFSCFMLKLGNVGKVWFIIILCWIANSSATQVNKVKFICENTCFSFFRK